MPDSLDSILSRLTPEQRADLRTAARHEFWRRGDLTYKLHADQLLVHEAIEKRNSTREVLEIARKWGKTTYLVIRAAMRCLAKPKSRVVYGAPTLKHLQEFILPVMAEVADDAPADLRPSYNQQSGHWNFPNGSYVHLFGADDVETARRGRGPKADEAIFDEAGFCPVLGYVLKDVLKPQLIYSRGPVILGSTPSDEPEHDFTRIAEIAEANGNYERRTIYDNPLLTKEQIDQVIEDDARDDGMTVEEYKRSPTFRREYMAERITDKTLAVMGDDWEAMRTQAMIEIPRPKFFDGYSILDMGGVDPHAVLFGYFHFGLAAFVAEDELLLREGENTSKLADGVKAKETSLWGESKYDGTLRGLPDVAQERLPIWLKRDVADNPPAQPYLRFCDNNTQIATDLHQLHGLTFIPTEKHEKRLAVNSFRVSVRSKGFYLHPRCRNTDRHLRQTTWKNARMTDYKRTNAGEHGDLLDTCVYGERNYRKLRNPEPEHWKADPDSWFIPESGPTEDERELVDAFSGFR